MSIAHVYTVAFEGIAALGSKHTYDFFNGVCRRDAEGRNE
jgi:hypothetical protein